MLWSQLLFVKSGGLLNQLFGLLIASILGKITSGSSQQRCRFRERHLPLPNQLGTGQRLGQQALTLRPGGKLNGRKRRIDHPHGSLGPEGAGGFVHRLLENGLDEAVEGEGLGGTGASEQGVGTQVLDDGVQEEEIGGDGGELLSQLGC